jgi:hypothetical protein
MLAADVAMLRDVALSSLSGRFAPHPLAEAGEMRRWLLA